jgi:hypothetical protein
VLALALPRPDALGRPFTASRAVALATADSVVRARGVDPGAWTRLAAPFTDSLGGWRRFLVTERAESLAVALADDYAPPAWWAVRYVRTTGTAAERAEEWRVRLLPDGTPLDHRHIVPDSAPRPRIAPDQARRVARAAIADAGIDTTTLREADFQATERPARSDVTVTWTDASVPLPGDAVARVWVTLAGDEPLGVRRGVELPETFTRAERDRGTTRLVILLVCAAVFFGLVVTATVWIVRRNAPVLDDGGTSRRRVVLAVVVLTAAGIASALNTLPDVFYRWPTSVPWSTFMGTTAVTIVTAVIPALVVVGLWLVMEALRRRVGVPLFPARDPATRDRRDRDLLLAGVGLGSVAALAGILARLPARAGVPGPHSTLLNQSVPLLGEALAIPLALAFTVVGVGIPALAVAGVSTRPVPRALAAALLALPLLVLALTLAPTGTNLVLLAGALVLAGVGAVWASLRWWATWCAWAWVVGALVYRGLADVRSILHASTAVERGAGAVALGLTAVLIALAVRAGRGAEWAEHSRGEGEGVAEAAGR